MKTLKPTVVNFLKTDRSLKGAKNLYNKMPGKSLALQNSFNRLRANNANDVRKICYELSRLVGLDDHQFQSLMSRNVAAPIEERRETTSPSTKKNATTKADASVVSLLDYDAKKEKYNDLRSYAKTLQEQLNLPEPKDQKKNTLIDFVTGAKNKALADVKTTLPYEVKANIKLRDQFPFLRDADCPPFLKELVNDLITSYENYKAGRKRLFDSMTKEQEAALAEDITGNYIDNKLAFKELEYYGEKGEILGEHPLYQERKVKNELSQLNSKQLSDKVNALRKNISTNKKKADKAKTEETAEKYRDKVSDYTWQLEFVTELLKKK